MKVYISAKDKQVLQKILIGDFDILLFGSRVKGNHQPFSDLDICLKGKEKLDRYQLAKFRFALEDSFLPYTVDLIDYARIDPSFREIVDAQSVLLAQAEPVD